MLSRLNLQTEGIKGNLMGNGFWTFINQFGNLVISFIIMVKMRNWIGEENAGTFVAGFSYAFLLSHIAIFGFDNLSIREIASFVSKKNIDKLRSYHRFSRNFVWIMSFIIMLLANWYFYQQNDTSSMYYLMAMPLIPFMTMTMLNQYKILGMGYVVHSQTPEKLIRPIIFLIGLIVIHFVVKVEDKLFVLLLINISAYLIVWLITDINFKSQLQSFQFSVGNIISTHKGKEDRRRWFYAAGGLFIYSVIGHLNGKVDIIMIDHLTDVNSDIAYYNSAHRFGGFVAFGALIVNQMMGPVISKHLSDDQVIPLKKVIAKTSFFSAIVGVFILIFFLIFGDDLLNYFFDRSIPAEFEVLKITAWGYFLQVIAGSAAFLLIMKSKTSIYATLSILIGLIINVACNFLLIPEYGIIGAAYGTTFSLLAWTVLMVVFAIVKTKVNPTLFSKHLF